MAMTLQNGGLIHDENRNVHYNNGPSIAGKAKAVISQRKSGRKPLGDVSNSRKPVSNLPSKWQNTKNVTFIDEETGAGKKKNTLKGTRKVLSDISNSGKPNLQEVSKKKHLKLSTVREESIGEERFLHNHQECIKSRNCNMDKDHFLSIVGLDLPKELKISTRKPDSPLMKLKDMVECTVFDRSPKKSRLFGSGRLSSPCCKSPRSPSVDTFSLWKDSDSINFTLIKTP